MPLVHADGRSILFIHVPKTGGSSVENYLLARFGNISLLDRRWETEWKTGGWKAATLRTSPQHITAKELFRITAIKPDYVFSVVRHPVARIISEYKFHLRSKRRARRLLAKTGFSNWLRIVTSAARQRATVFDNHIRPQSDMVPNDCDIFRLEDGLDKIAFHLDALFGPASAGLEIGHALKSPDRCSVELSTQDYDLIERFWEQDFVRFGYANRSKADVCPDFYAPWRSAAGALLAPACNLLYGTGRL